MTLRRSLFAVLLIAVVLGTEALAKKKSLEEISAGNGYALVSFPRNHGRLTLNSVADGKRHTIDVDELSGVGGAWLPPGDYELTGITYGTILEGGVKSADLAGYPAFRINEGQITDLGSLIYFAVGEKGVIWLPMRLSTNDSLTEVTASTFAEALQGQDALVWQPTELPEISESRTQGTGMGLIVDLGMNRVDKLQRFPLQQQLTEATTISGFYDIALKLLPPLQQPAVSDPQGNIYFGADMGQVKVRSASGVWSNLHTGLDETITATSWADDVLYAATATGRIAASRDGGESWKMHAELGSVERILDLEIVGDSLYVLTRNKDADRGKKKDPRVATVYAGSKNDPGDFEALKTFEFKDVIYRNPHAEFYDGKYYAGIGPKFLHVLNTNDGTWSELTGPKSFNSFRISKSNGSIALIRIQGAFSALHVSADSGATWKKLKRPPAHVADLHIESPASIMTHRGKAKTFSVAHFVQRYNPKSDAWTDIAEAPEACKYLIADAEFLNHFCVTFGGEVLKFDEGNWIIESE